MMTILIVDDHVDTLYVLKDLIENVCGKEVVSILATHNPLQVIKLLQKNSVQLIFLDIMMPEMDGIQLGKKIRELSEYKKTPIVYISAKTDKYTRQEAKKYGQEFIEKPFTIQEIQKVLKEFGCDV